MKLVRIFWPFSDQRLQLTKAEKATLMRAAAIAERAAEHFEPEGAVWLEWKRLETAARDGAECE